MQVRQAVAAYVVDHTDTSGIRALDLLADSDASICVVGHAGAAVGGGLVGAECGCVAGVAAGVGGREAGEASVVAGNALMGLVEVVGLTGLQSIPKVGSLSASYCVIHG